MNPRIPHFSSPSFALISVLALVSLAALTATAFLASARLERQATRPLGDTARLEMACNSARECASQTLNRISEPKWNTLATYWRGTNENDWTNELGHLLLGRPNSFNNVRWTYFCGFNSAVHKKLDSTVFLIEGTNTNPGSYLTEIGSFMAEMTNGFITNPTSTNTNCTLIPLLGGRTSPPVGWTYIYQDKKIANSTNTTNVPVARFSYYMEDLSGLIDAERMGGSDRTTGTNSSEISLTNLTTNWSSNSIISAANFAQFISPTNRAKYFSPALILYANTNISTNDLRYFAHGLLSWDKFPNTIPIGVPINKDRGYTQQEDAQLKLNLNDTANLTVSKIANTIISNCTTTNAAGDKFGFYKRAGGLTNSILYTTNDFDYAKCLAANIIDYIDPDSNPTALDAAEGYRGTEALPYCTEFALRFRIEDGLTTQCKDKTNNLSIVPANSIRPSINAYLELWNPHATNIPLSTLGISFKSYGTNLPTSEEACVIGCNQFVKTIDEVAANYENGSSGSLSNLTFDFDTAMANNNVNPPANTLASNAYCVIKLDHKHERLYPSPVSSNNWLKAGDYRFIYSGNTNTERFLYTSRNTSRFSAACTNLPGSKEELDVASGGVGSMCQAAVLELSTTVGGAKIVFDRMRKILLNTSKINIKDIANEGNNYSTFSLGLFAGQVSDKKLNTGDPRINYFLRQSNNAILCSASSFLNSSFGGPNSTSLIPGSTNFSTAPPTNCKVDITQWPDGGHNPTLYGINPSGSNPQRNPSNEPISNSIVAFESKNVPSFIRNGPMTNILELGNIYDPILWRRVDKGNITINSIADPSFGGGNTLRIGRSEHPRFAFQKLKSTDTYPVPNMSQSAVALLDIFSLSDSSDNGGKINLNTAPAPVLRALAGSVTLSKDPAMSPSSTLAITNNMTEAFAQGVMRFRAVNPFLTPSQLAFIATDYGITNPATSHWTNTWPTNAVFGNTNPTISLSTNAPGNTLGWTSASIGVSGWNDQAAEEWFSKIYNLSSVQSWNFRCYTVAQLVDSNGLPTGPTMRKYSLIYIRYNDPFTEGGDAESGPITTFESLY